MQLIAEHQRIALAQQISLEIDEWCKSAYDDGHRNHLGASLIGHECNRYLWYTFRWVEAAAFSGRVQRLFNRGHQTEPRFIEWLRGIGFEVWEVDPATGKQFRIHGVQGHFGGSLDGILRAPAAYKINEPLLLEMKTAATGPKFNALKEKGVKKEKPQHYAQMCSYGVQYGFKYALYMAINKNDDDIHIEIVELDWDHGAQMVARAEAIITAEFPPHRVNESPAFWLCKLCDRHDVCHKGAKYEVNCRSCHNAQPVANGEWWCKHWGAVIPPDAIPKACGHWHQVGRA